MDTKIILFILAGVFVVLLSGFYILYRRINRLETANLQLQRYLLVSQQMGRGVSDAPVEPSQGPPQRPPPQSPSPQRPSPPRPSPPNLNNVLPMVNTFMNMFQGAEGPEPEDIEDKAKEMVQEDKKRRGLEREIEQELEELQSSEIKEGRVENETESEEEESISEDENASVVETVVEDLPETKAIPVVTETTVKAVATAES